MNSIGPDEHLRTALKHAPDADALPPAHVSAQIIAAAHRSVADAPCRATQAQAPWWRRPWGASGAVASLLLAGFIGLLRRGETPGPAVDEPTTAPAATPAAVVATATPASMPMAPAAAMVPAPATLRQAVAPARSAAAEGRAAAKMSNEAAPERARPLADAAPPPVPLAAAPASPPPAPAPAVVAAAPPRSASRLAAAVAPSSLPEQQEGDQWIWQGDRMLVSPDAAWLARLGQLTQNRWHDDGAAGAAMGNATGAAPQATQLLWQRAGRPLGSLRFESDAVWWCAAEQACQRAAVPAEALKELLAALARTR